MKKRIIQFLTTYFLFVLLFVLQKPIFMVYYHDLYTNVSLGDYFRVMWHGLPLDLSLAGYLTAIPGLLLIASAWTNSSILRRIRQGYFGVIAFIMACIFIIDLGLYGFWGFRLDATPVFYFFSSPKDAMASVSFWFVLLGILSMLIYAAILYFIFYCVLIREKKPSARLIRFPVITKPKAIKLTASSTHKSTKEAIEIAIGCMALETPKINKRLKIFEPTTLPTAIPVSPLDAATIDVTSSGRLVPIATIVKPTNVSLMPHASAIFFA